MMMNYLLLGFYSSELLYLLSILRSVVKIQQSPIDAVKIAGNVAQNTSVLHVELEKGIFAQRAPHDAVCGAGNNNEDACHYSPSGSADVIVAGAVDSKMRRWYTSNW